MPDSAEALLIAFLLMPGCFGYFVFSRVYNGQITDTFDKTISVIIFNIVALFAYGLLWPIQSLDFRMAKLSDFPQLVSFSAMALATLCAISAAFAIVAGISANSRKIAGAALRLGFTLRGHQPSVLAAVIAEHPSAFFKVRFKSGGHVTGHPRLYSLQGDECCLYLEKARRRAPRKNDTSPQPPEYAVDNGVLLVNFDDILCVELV